MSPFNARQRMRARCRHSRGLGPWRSRRCTRYGASVGAGAVASPGEPLPARQFHTAHGLQSHLAPPGGMAAQQPDVPVCELRGGALMASPPVRSCCMAHGMGRMARSV
jgi:hypothetical protein